MSVGARLREERTRLGMNQPDFAALAGVSKRVQHKWEKDESSPTALIMTAWAEAGVDVLYILTGKRTVDRPDNAPTQIADQLAEMRRSLIDPARRLLPGESAHEAEARVLSSVRGALAAMKRHDAAFLTPTLRNEVEALAAIVADPVQLATFRAADLSQLRTRRKELRDSLSGWFNEQHYAPSDAVATILANVGLEYGVPTKVLVELAEELVDDFRRQRHAQPGGAESTDAEAPEG